YLLSDPISTANKTSYKEFSDVYGFGPTTQFVRNVRIVIESTLERYLNTIQYICGDFFEALANSSIIIENVGDENNKKDDVERIFENVKVDNKLACNNPMEFSYYSSGLFEDICFECEKVPENECDESARVSINEVYYYYCDECYTTVSNKKKRNKDVKFQLNYKELLVNNIPRVKFIGQKEIRIRVGNPSNIIHDGTSINKDDS
ncbi:11947_t:CDS:2, partial [Funneliformis geosporum]